LSSAKILHFLRHLPRGNRCGQRGTVTGFFTNKATVPCQELFHHYSILIHSDINDAT